MQLIKRTILWLSLSFCFLLISAVEQVSIQINWTQEDFVLTPRHWSVNDYEILHPERVAQQGLIDFARKLSPGIIRIHQAQIADTWSDEILEDWNYERINQSFKAAKQAYGDAVVLLNPICRWPKWLAKEDKLSEQQIEKLVKLCKDLAIHIKKNPQWNVKYWEILNEGEEYWEKQDILLQYWDLYNRMAMVIKRELPDVKIGGPALTWPKPLWVNTFLDQCGHNIDFISWHNYGSGNPETPSSDLFGKSVNDIENQALCVKSECEKRNLKVEYLLTEFNIQWVWTPFEVRHANNEGAVFQSLVIQRLAPIVDAICIWHLKGHSYGLIDDNNKVRATGRFYLWGRDYLVGSAKKYSSSHPSIVVIPVENEHKRKAVLLINTSTDIYELSSKNKIGFNYSSVQQINANWSVETNLSIPKKILLKPYSLTLITQ